MADGSISAPFHVTTGVLRVDVLAPFLFITLIDYLMKKATQNIESGVVTHPRRSRRYPAESLKDLDFADDIALLESSMENAQAQNTRTAAASEYHHQRTQDGVHDHQLQSSATFGGIRATNKVMCLTLNTLAL